MMEKSENDIVISLVVVFLDLSIVGITTYNIAYEILNFIFELGPAYHLNFSAYLLLILPVLFLDFAISYALKHRIIRFEKRGLLVISFFLFSLVISLLFLSFNIIV
jgi:hypothetical protein